MDKTRTVKSLLILLHLLLFQQPALAQMKVFIQYQDQFGRWHPYQTKHNERDAYRSAESRAKSTGKRYRLVDQNGQLLDLVNP